MRTPEQRLWDAMRKARPPDILLDRIENLVGDGTPDLFAKARAAKRSCWIEMKVASRPKRPTTSLLGEAKGLNIDQRNWHDIRNNDFGVPTFILVRDDAMQIYLVSGQHALIINGMTQSELARHSLASSWGATWAVLRQL